MISGQASGPALDDDLFTFLTHHVAVPAALIAMVAAFLSYLVDVRSAFVGAGPQLKWIGFCFAVATVLIERHRRTSGDEDLQGVYTIALGLATISVMMIEPWETRAVGLGERLANLLIIAAVWRFATQVTKGMSPEVGRPAWTASRLYGVERLRAEAFQRQKALETGAEPPRPKQAPEIPPNPAAAIGRLAALALLAFALGEPVLLRATPEIGVRALAAVIIFLFATGVVLAAGSSLDSHRRVENEGGWVSPHLVPARMALAGILLVVVLAAALAIPGLRFQGTGSPAPRDRGRRSDQSPEKGLEGKRGAQDPRTAGEGGRTSPSGEEAGKGPRSDSGSGSKPSPALTGPAAELVRLLSAAGKWLLVPVALALIAAGLWLLVRLLPLLAGRWGRMTNRLRDLLKRLLGRFRWSRRSPGAVALADPFAKLESLSLLPSREAVLAAYQRFLLLLEVQGYARPPKSTPYEVLHALPFSFRGIAEAVEALTELYVQAAYSEEPLAPGDGERAIFLLKGMRGLLEKSAA
jgi:hypothetical protein